MRTPRKEKGRDQSNLTLLLQSCYTILLLTLLCSALVVAHVRFLLRSYLYLIVNDTETESIMCRTHSPHLVVSEDLHVLLARECIHPPGRSSRYSDQTSTALPSRVAAPPTCTLSHQNELMLMIFTLVLERTYCGPRNRTHVVSPRKSKQAKDVVN